MSIEDFKVLKSNKKKQELQVATVEILIRCEEKIIYMTVVKHCVPREVLEYPFLEIFNT